MNKIQHIGAVLLLMVVTACSKDDSPNHPGNYPQDGLVRITTGLNALKTRGSEVYTNYTGSDLSLTIQYVTGEGSSNRTNVKWTNNGSGSWTQDLTADASPMMWKNATETASIYAFAPYGATPDANKKITFTVQTDQSSGTASSDLVAFKADGFKPDENLSGTSQAINIKLDHQLTMLNIALNYGYELTGKTYVVKAITVNAKPTVVYNLATGAPESASGSAINLTANTTGSNAYAVIFPAQTIASNTAFVAVTLTIDGTDRTFTYIVGAAEQHVFASGTAYTLNLRVGRDQISLAGISVTDWDDNGGNDHPAGGGETASTVLDLNNYPILDNSIISAAIVNGKLTVVGTINATKLRAIGDYCIHVNNISHLDLSRVTGMPSSVDDLFGQSSSPYASATNLTEVNFPAGAVTTLNYTFYMCTNLSRVTGLEQGLKELHRAFYRCPLTLDNFNFIEVTDVKVESFYRSLIRTFDGPEVINIEGGAFAGCRELIQVNLPKATSVDESIFSADGGSLYCASLREIWLTAPYFNKMQVTDMSIYDQETLSPFMKIVPNQITLHLNASQEANINVAAKTWSPKKQNGSTPDEMGAPIPLHELKAVYCGDKLVLGSAD